ncbi:choloylglycine hydrolase [Nitratireductor aquibiodomus]|uniref:Choloylglycine hydrolase n=1 Tax=Nitratireductor aquibiodomus TaxID=204799 RepID=A0A1H4L5G4_9HYPH|nr:linear amide C-N hydrolase [Nitratireductor aquibiodomus]SEB65668.1 choloylglycine hydrolase [Nitratireductor aquibiodomus]
MKLELRRTVSLLLAATAIASAPLQTAQACSRILSNDNGLGIFVSRTMDWPESTEPVLTVMPRGMERDGGMVGDEHLISDNPARWTSRYGSIVTTVYGVGTVDGFNEKGLAVHLLYLSATELPERDPSKPGLQVALWGQYVLDNAATVSEALTELEKVQLVMAEVNGHKGTLHLVMEDATGDSAVIEYLDGKATVHHGKDYRIVTNDPAYDEQLAMLAEMDFSNPSSDTPLPGNVRAKDRFQRAAYYTSMLPKPENEQQAIAGVLAIARNVSVPFGAPYGGFGIYNTEYRTAINLSEGRYFFELTTSPNVIWTELAKFDLSEGAPVMTLDPDDISLAGDVTGSFKKSDAPF